MRRLFEMNLGGAAVRPRFPCLDVLGVVSWPCGLLY